MHIEFKVIKIFKLYGGLRLDFTNFRTLHLKSSLWKLQKSLEDDPTLIIRKLVTSNRNIPYNLKFL